MSRQTTPTRDKAGSGQERAFQGWARRGAVLDARQVALFTPGRIVKHLGTDTLHLGPPRDWPVQFVVYLHLGWRWGSHVILPADTCFEVRAAIPMLGGRTCIALEQVGEGWGTHGLFREELGRGLRAIAHSLPSPSAKQRQQWGTPFACWLPASRPGDAPISGPIYDFEEAVRYASAWSGVEEARTYDILSAHQRYLELAGIAEVEDEEALLKERVEVAHLLPDPPGCVDERVELYIAAATGHGIGDIQSVDRGEMAYLDHLGLVTWDFEGERDERLGKPHWVFGDLHPLHDHLGSFPERHPLSLGLDHSPLEGELMKHAKLGPAEAILSVGCEGGGLTLLRAEVLAWEEPVADQRKRKRTHFAEEARAELPREVFWTERNDYRTTFQEAVTCFLDKYAWWSLYPSAVHPRWREAVISLLEHRFPGWRGAPSCWAEECHDIKKWIEILQPPPPVLTLTYRLRRPGVLPRGIRIEITSTQSTEGKCWEVPIRSVEEDWSKWRPEVPGISLPDEDAARILEGIQQASFSLPMPADKKQSGLEHTLTLAMGNSHLQVTWGDFLPIELASLKGFVSEYLDSWFPNASGE